MPNLKNILKEVKKASRGHKISSVGIEFGSSSIKLVHLIEDKGVVSLQNYGEIDLGPLVGKPTGSVANLDVAKLQQAMTTLLGTVPINDPEAISVAIPLSATLVVPLELNTEATGEALTSLVMAEVKSQIPVPLSQVYVDWQVVNDDPEVGFVSDNSVNVVTPEVSDVALDLDPQEPKETKSKPTSLKKIICFVINKEIIQTYQTVLNNLGFEIEYFELEIYSVMRAAVPNDVKQALIVDIGARYTKLYVVENGKIVEAVKKLHGGQDYTAIIAQSLQIDTQKAEDLKRTLDLGSLKGTQLSTELELSINKVSDKIKQLMAEYKLSSSVPIYLSGGGSLLFGLPEYIANSLAVKVIICQPFINTSAPAYLDKLLVETGPEYAVSAGLALKHIRTI